MVIYFWILLIVIQPLVMSVTFFPRNPLQWPLLFLVSLACWPAYLMYSYTLGPPFLYQKRILFFVIISILSFGLFHALIFALYSIALKFPIPEAFRFYYSYTLPTVFRESCWILLNMSLATAIYFIRKSREEREQLEDTKKENAYFKLRYLRAQLSPHFLFNTLNSIYSLSLQKSEQTPDVVVRLAEIMRYLIYECNEETITLEKEITFIRNYIEIEKIRYDADIRFTVTGETEGVFIEPFLFISFIENGFKHAMENSFARPFIYITLDAQPGQIALNVINSSNADLESQAKRIGGKGISTSRNLLEILYPDRYALNIIQTKKEEGRESELRLRHARERLEMLYPDAYTLDVILNKDSFTVSLIVKSLVA